MKVCSKCQVEKDYSNYYSDKRKKDGLCTACKECHYLATRKWKLKNPELMNQYNRKYLSKNPEKGREFDRRYEVKNIEKQRIRKARVAKESRDELRPTYVRQKLMNRGFTDMQIRENPALIETLKTILNIKRLCKSQLQTLKN